MNKYKRRLLYILFVVVLISVGITAALVIPRLLANTDYKYPLLAGRVQNETQTKYKINFTDLRADIDEYLDSVGEIGKNTSVYFEYLPTGISINLNPDSKAVAASLMKVPAVMNLYMAAELGHVDMDKKIALKPEWLNSQYGTLYKKGPGYEISLREAARLTLKDSDNTAVAMIWEHLEEVQGTDNDALEYLDIQYSLSSTEEVFVNPRSYSSIMKCLYFACHTSRESSQEMLTYLAESSFNDRLVKYIPDDVLVAHKIGTYDDDYQSDCGIFYTENRYLLCIMVKGDHVESSSVMADISHKVYEHLTANSSDSVEDTN